MHDPRKAKKGRMSKKLRKIAAPTHGKRGRYLGKALKEAREKRTKEKDTVAATLRLLDEGLKLQGVKYKRRDELHQR